MRDSSEEFMEIMRMAENILDMEVHEESNRRLDEYFEKWYRSQNEK